MTIRIQRRRVSSKTSKVLRDTLNQTVPTKQLKLQGSVWKGTNKDLLINWGSSSPLHPEVNAVVLNKPEAVAKAADKLKTFASLYFTPYPTCIEHSGDTSDFLELLADLIENSNSNKTVFRNTSTGYGGEGITVIEDLYSDYLDNDEGFSFSVYLENRYEEEGEFKDLVDSTVFVTSYFEAKDEYRIHVMFGKVIFAQRKGLRTDDQRPEHPNFTVRNHANGFIFQQNNINVPTKVKEICCTAVTELGLDFGAVDVRYNPNSKQTRVLEINTAPALTGTTLDTYTSSFLTAHEVVQEGLGDVPLTPLEEDYSKNKQHK